MQGGRPDRRFRFGALILFFALGLCSTQVLRPTPRRQQLGDGNRCCSSSTSHKTRAGKYAGTTRSRAFWCATSTVIEEATCCSQRPTPPTLPQGLGHVPGRGKLESDGAGGYWIRDIDEAVPGNRYLLRVGAKRVDHRVVHGGVRLLAQRAGGGRARRSSRSFRNGGRDARSRRGTRTSTAESCRHPRLGDGGCVVAFSTLYGGHRTPRSFLSAQHSLSIYFGLGLFALPGIWGKRGRGAFWAG